MADTSLGHVEPGDIRAQPSRSPAGTQGIDRVAGDGTLSAHDERLPCLDDGLEAGHDVDDAAGELLGALRAPRERAGDRQLRTSIVGRLDLPRHPDRAFGFDARIP